MLLTVVADFYANVAPRRDEDRPRADNAGERLVAGRLESGDRGDVRTGYEIFARGRDAAELFGRPASGTPVEIVD